MELEKNRYTWKTSYLWKNCYRGKKYMYFYSFNQNIQVINEYVNVIISDFFGSDKSDNLTVDFFFFFPRWINLLIILTMFCLLFVNTHASYCSLSKIPGYTSTPKLSKCLISCIRCMMTFQESSAVGHNLL